MIFYSDGGRHHIWFELDGDYYAISPEGIVYPAFDGFEKEVLMRKIDPQDPQKVLQWFTNHQLDLSHIKWYEDT